MSGFFSVPTKEEDQASANADLGYPVQAVRKATPANTSGTDGDYEFLQMVNGRLWVNPGSDADNSANSTTKLPVLPARANAADPTWTEGNQVPLSADLTGHQRVTATQDGTWSLITTPITGSAQALGWTSGTALNTALTFGVTGMSAVSVLLIGTAPLTGGQIDFSVSPDGTTFEPIFAIDPIVQAEQNGYAVAAGESILTFNVSAFQSFRATLTSVITGAGHVDVKIYGGGGTQGVTYVRPGTFDGTFGVNDAAGTLTVDAPVGTPVFVRLSDGTSAIATLPVSLASVPSHPVTNAGTFAVQATIGAGSAVIGHVIADTGSTTVVTGNVTVVQPTGTSLHAVLDTTSTTAVTQATAANLNAQVQGPAASAAAKSGNPVQTGAVFNTTQPTVTTGQVVENQATARGGLIVATGVDSFITKELRSATPTDSTVAASVSNVTLLASNANRLGATIYNDSTAKLKIKLGATASATSFAVILKDNASGVGGYYEVPYGYTGIVDGIWDSAAGNARIEEIAA